MQLNEALLRQANNIVVLAKIKAREARFEANKDKVEALEKMLSERLKQLGM